MADKTLPNVDPSKLPVDSPPAGGRTDPSSAAERPAYVTSRLRYFNGEFLGTKDFIDEQNYHTDRQMRHEWTLHSPGILAGLDVKLNQDGTLTVTAGSALDGAGNQILLASDQALSPSTDGFSNPGTYYVDVLFAETADTAQTASGGNTRWTQEPRSSDPDLSVLAIGPAQRTGSILLATVTVTDGGTTVNTYAGHDSGPRTYAGLRLPGADPDGKSTATLRVADKNTPTDDPGYKPNYKVILDQNVFLAGSSGLELENGELVFLNSPGSIWAHDYSQRILLQQGGVELQAGDKIILTTNNYKDPDTGQYTDIPTLVAHKTGDVGIGIGTTDPSARLHVRGEDQTSLNGALRVEDSAGTSLLYVRDDGMVGIGTSTPGARLAVDIGVDGQGNGLSTTSLKLEHHGSNLTVRPLAAGGSSTVVENTGSGALVLNPNGGAGGNVGIGTGSATPAARLEVRGIGTDSSAKALVVSSSDATARLTVANDGHATFSGAVTAASGLTVSSGDLSVTTGNVVAPQYTFPTPSYDPAPTITARVLPDTQGGGGTNNEREELILFVANDYTSTYGPDAITLRAAALRLQTYNSNNVTSIDVVAGCNDRLYIDPNGHVAIGKPPNDFPYTVSSRLEVWGTSTSAAVLAVGDSTVTVGGGLTVSTGGLTVSAGGLTVSAGGLTVSAGGLTISSGTFTVPSGGLTVSGGSLTVSGAMAAQSTLIVSGLLTASSGLTVTGTVQAASGALQVGSGLTLTSGDLTLPSSGHLKASSGMVQVSGGLSLSGASTLLGGWTRGGGLSDDNSSSGLNFTLTSDSDGDHSASQDIISDAAATTDGFILVEIGVSGSDDTRGYVEVFTGTGTSQSTVSWTRRGRASNHQNTGCTVQDNTVTAPVRKGEYWKVHAVSTQRTILIDGYWIPFGN